jgi:hypothetical protein
MSRSPAALNFAAQPAQDAYWVMRMRLPSFIVLTSSRACSGATITATIL